MADTKALFTQRFDAARTALTQGDEPAAAESLQWAIAAARSDPGLQRELASALFHLGRLSRKFGRAGEAEAEPLLTEALAISEGLFGREHAALAPLLNELSRLHVRRSQHARAEDVLERLLAIARGKGEENADVAIALAGLAVVKRKLGDDASAEALYRDALRIQENVLEPNHMLTVATLERLSETCEARGKFAEALALRRRALATREVALGPGHPTAQAARSRVAELELQVAIAADTAAVAAARAARGPMPTPAWVKATSEAPAETPPTAAPPPIKPPPINSEELEFLGESQPKVLRPAPRPRERAKTPAVTAAVAAASLMASPIQTPSVPLIVISPPESARPSGIVTDRESGAAHRDAVLADVAHRDIASGDAALGDAALGDVALGDVALGDVALGDVALGDVALGDVALGDAALGDRESSIALVQADSPEPASKKRTVLYASAGVAAAAIAIAGLLMLRPRAGRGSDPVSTEISAAQRTTAAGAPVVTAPATSTVFTATGAAAMVGARRADSLGSASATPAPTAPVVQPEQRAPESAPPELRLPRVEVHLGPINIPTPAAPSIDSIVRSATERQRASDTGRTGTGDGVSLRTSADVDNAPTPPKIIGRMPEARFPDALLRAGKREGRVVVRFMVNELGSVDVASMIVERSDHELFTAAVRDILTRFRFEPARTHAPESKPVATWVSMPFLFTTKK